MSASEILETWFGFIVFKDFTIEIIKDKYLFISAYYIQG